MSGRCRACDAKLTDFEMTRKVRSPCQEKFEYLDLCHHCFSLGDFEEFDVLDREDLGEIYYGEEQEEYLDLGEKD